MQTQSSKLDSVAAHPGEVAENETGMLRKPTEQFVAAILEQSKIECRRRLDHAVPLRRRRRLRLAVVTKTDQ